ncbi:MAG: hypothetical protein KDC26_02475 [Armatimonadetes bacterium]|nr:hypothetical protein [Armatimonadota bacterium]
MYQLVEQDDSDFSVRLPHIHGAIIGRVAAPKIYIEPELQSQCRQIISKVSKPTHDPNWVEEWEIFVFETGVSHENYQEIISALTPLLGSIADYLLPGTRIGSIPVYRPNHNPTILIADLTDSGSLYCGSEVMHALEGTPGIVFADASPTTELEFKLWEIMCETEYIELPETPVYEWILNLESAFDIQFARHDLNGDITIPKLSYPYAFSERLIDKIRVFDTRRIMIKRIKPSPDSSDEGP